MLSASLLFLMRGSPVPRLLCRSLRDLLFPMSFAQSLEPRVKLPQLAHHRGFTIVHSDLGCEALFVGTRVQQLDLVMLALALPDHAL